MTSSSIKNFSWALKSKKRHRSGSGGSKDNEAIKKSFLARKNALSRRPGTGTLSSSSSSNLEVVTPSTSDVEFKYTWPINGFLKQVKSGGGSPYKSKSCSAAIDSTTRVFSSKNSASNADANGLDSSTFDIHVNGVQTSWNLSIRFWVGEDGERLANPFVLCLNMLSCKVGSALEIGIKYKFGVLNRGNNEYEMGLPNKKDFTLENSDTLKSVGYRNMAISEKHMNCHGDIQLVVKMNIFKEDTATHSLSSDLLSLINDEKSADVVIKSEGKKFNVHRNILSARSPVFADLLIDSKSGEKLDTLELTDFPSETLEELLKYIYTDSSANVDLFANKLLEASDRYQLPGLKNHCEKHLVEIISPDNVASVLLLAERHKCLNLKKSAINYCRDNDRYIMKDAQWKTIEEEKPDLFEEAIAEVAKESCNKHIECLKKKGKRFELEKTEAGGKEL